MKGREVRAALDGQYDPKLVHCIASVAEEVSAMGQELTALAQILDQITDVIGGITETMGEIKHVAERNKNV
jgi:methyl-accepting chemotaxis protein